MGGGGEGGEGEGGEEGGGEMRNEEKKMKRKKNENHTSQTRHISAKKGLISSAPRAQFNPTLKGLE